MMTWWWAALLFRVVRGPAQYKCWRSYCCRLSSRVNVGIVEGANFNDGGGLGEHLHHYLLKVKRRPFSIEEENSFAYEMQWPTQRLDSSYDHAESIIFTAWIARGALCQRPVEAACIDNLLECDDSRPS